MRPGLSAAKTFGTESLGTEVLFFKAARRTFVLRPRACEGGRRCAAPAAIVGPREGP